MLFGYQAADAVTTPFEDKELGKVTPYGVYDVGANAGWVSVGDHERYGRVRCRLDPAMAEPHVSSANLCNSIFHSLTRAPFEPPQSAVIVSSRASG